jgi:pheromone shutdown-related protein TraB
MLEYQNLTLIGTSHISRQSKIEVRKAILEIEPSIVAIELDKQRLQGLLSNKKSKIRVRDIRKIGVRGYLFAIVGSWAQQRLGKMVGSKPGDEMKEAVKSAAKIKAKVALVDQNVTITIKKLFKTLTFREYFRFFADIVKGLIFRKSEIEPFDLNKIPSEKIIEKMVGLVKDRYPSVYKVLISDRNEYMARRIISLMKTNPDQKIIAIVGAGHQKGMIKIIKKAIS